MAKGRNNYRIKKIDGLFYIQRKFMFWWVKVPDSGLGWGVKSMAFISGCESRNVSERIMKEYYTYGKGKE